MNEQPISPRVRANIKTLASGAENFDVTVEIIGEPAPRGQMDAVRMQAVAEARKAIDELKDSAPDDA